MIELRWKKTSLNPATAKAMGVEYKPNNWVCIEDEDYAVLQYRTAIVKMVLGPEDKEPLLWSNWQDVGIE